MPGYDHALYGMYLSRVPMFSSCPPDQLDLIAQLGEAVSFGDGSDVVCEGDIGDAFYVITDGSATVRRAGGEVAQLAPGDYFGELSLFDPAPRNATVTAGKSLACVKLSRAAFAQALEKIPTVRDTLLHGMARRIHELDRRV